MEAVWVGGEEAAAAAEQEAEEDDDATAPPTSSQWDLAHVPTDDAAVAVHVRHVTRVRVWQQLREAPAQQVARIAEAFCEGVTHAALARAAVQRWTRAFLFDAECAHLGAARRHLGAPLSPERFQALFYTVLFAPVAVELHPTVSTTTTTTAAAGQSGALVTLFRRQAQARADQEMARLLAVPTAALDARTAHAAALMGRFPERFFARAHLRSLASTAATAGGEQVLIGCRFNSVMERMLPRVQLLDALVMGSLLNVGLHRFRRGEEARACKQVRHCMHLVRRGLLQAERQYVLAVRDDLVTEVSPMMRRQRTPSVTPPTHDDDDDDDDDVDDELYSRHVQRDAPEYRAALQQRVLDAVRRHVVELEQEAYARRACDAMLDAARTVAAPTTTPPVPRPSATRTIRTSQDEEARLDPFGGAMVRDYAPPEPVRPVWHASASPRDDDTMQTDV